MVQRVLLLIFGAGLWASLALPVHAETSRKVAVELVLAVDASDSMDDNEWRLELDGIAEAFRSKEVRSLIAALPHKRIAVAMLAWGASYQGHDFDRLAGDRWRRRG